MMKKQIKIIVFGVIFLTTLFQACKDKFVEMNTDPNAAPTAYPHQFMANALINSVGANMNRNRGFNNELMQISVSIGDSDGRVFRYDFRRNWSDYLWNSHYMQISNFKEMYKAATNELTFNTSYQGISLVCQTWLYSILTDTYGDIPYFRSNLAADSLILEPEFDRQQDVYMALFHTLDSANTLLRANQSISINEDPVFQGDVSKWRRFCNSLYLRLLMRVSAKSEMQEFVVDKIKEILQTNVSAYPTMTSNDHSAILRWTDEGAYVSPFKTVRAQDFRATAICSFFIDYLRDTNDPRINIPEYGTSSINRMGIAPVSGNYVGVPSGYAQGEGDITKQSYFYSYDQNNGVNSLQTEPLTGTIMPFAEIEFIKAEAIIKGWITGNAATHYYSGVENSIKMWLPNWPKTAQEHLSESDISWDDAASLNEKMQALHLQKYYGLFMIDMQQWFEHRRTGYPVLPKGPGLKNNGEMPARMTYPIYLQSANPTNYKAAVAQQGPDEINTKMWWQKP